MVLDTVTDYARELLTPTVRLGVTGLSRAGKTVFITSLVDNLLNNGRLPFFEPARQGRIVSVFLEPQPDDTVPRFDYETHRALLRGSPPDVPPDWPEGTTQISQLRLTFEYEAEGLWSSAIEALTGRHVLHLDIVDYPGEWLLDLPLLNMTYESWSRDAMRLAREPLRYVQAQNWLSFVEELDPTATQDETIAKTGADTFRRYLEACRAENHVLSTIPPGRFLLPGELTGSPALTFMPLEIASDAKAEVGSMHAMMARRFEAYKTRVVKPFYQDHFAKLDRQIVLVDTLVALNAGPEAVSDLERALGSVLASFKTGSNSWLSAILGKRIDRLMFAATKADHLHEDSHDRLKAILGALTEKARGQADFAGAETGIEAIASVRATRQGTAKQDGETLPCIIGTPLPGEIIDGTTFHGSREAAIFPGDLPDDPAIALAGAKDDAHDTTFVRFRPPVAANALTPLPHIRLDRVLQFLLGDRLT